MLKAAIDKANKLSGGCPRTTHHRAARGHDDDRAGGYVYIRPGQPSGIQGRADRLHKNVPEYPFPILDPARIIRSRPEQSRRRLAGQGEPTSTYPDRQTWPVVKA